MKTDSPLPADPDQAAAAEETRRFRRTVWSAIALIAACVTTAVAVAALQTKPLLAAAAGGVGMAFGVLAFIYGFAVEARPDLGARLGLRGSIDGDERERHIARDTTVRVYSVTLMCVLLYAILIDRNTVVMVMCGVGAVVDVVVRQIRLRRP